MRPAEPLPDGYLDLYKLAVEMADRVSARRTAANTFFLTANTALVAVLGGQELRWYGAAAGIAFATAWWALLRSYRDLNRAKFAVILEMEERLPARVFADEWTALQEQSTRSWAARYRELGRVERLVPVVFAGIYVAELVRQGAT